jgi:ankyrin repeat protein
MELAWNLAGSRLIVDVLLRNDADIHATTLTGLLPLHQAAMNGHLDTVVALLAKEAEGSDRGQLSSANAADNSGCVPLHWAAMEGHHDVVEVLIANGADASRKNKRGATPSDWAKMKHPSLAVRLRHAANASRLSTSQANKPKS